MASTSILEKIDTGKSARPIAVTTTWQKAELNGRMSHSAIMGTNSFRKHAAEFFYPVTSSVSRWIQ